MSGPSGGETQSLVGLRDVRFRWGRGEGFGIEVDRLDVAVGERVLLVGPSGSGKSTLLAVIAGIVAPQAGEVAVLGTDIARLRPSARDRFRAEHMGVVFQLFNLLPYGSLVDNVVLSLQFADQRRARVGGSAAQEAEARRLLGRLGIDTKGPVGGGAQPGNGTRAVRDLSVGQQQRVAVARALIGRPELLIADEPTSALDPDSQKRFLELLFAEVASAEAGLLMVSHDPAIAAHFDRVVKLGDVVRVVGADVPATPGDGG